VAYKSVATASVGAASELRVCVDLLLKGFHVFRAVSPACACDLMLLHGDKALRIEVRTVSSTGSYSAKGRYDIIAAVGKESIKYTPALPVLIQVSNHIEIGLPGPIVTGEAAVLEAQRKRVARTERHKAKYYGH